jgi:hypothetical protein
MRENGCLGNHIMTMLLKYLGFNDLIEGAGGMGYCPPTS